MHCNHRVVFEALTTWGMANGQHHDPQTRRRCEDAPARARCGASPINGGRGTHHPSRCGERRYRAPEPRSVHARVLCASRRGRTRASSASRSDARASRLHLKQQPCLVIDTNVASELMRPEPSSSVAAWIADRDASAMYLTAVSEAELRFGVAILPAGSRRTALEAAIRRWLEVGFGERILPFDSSADRAYAEIADDRRSAGSANRRSRLPDRGHIPLDAEPVWLRGTYGISQERESTSLIPGRRSKRHFVQGNRANVSI